MIRKKCKQIITCTVKEPWVAYLWIFFDSKFSKCLPQRTIFKGSFPAIENVFQERGLKTARSLQLANTDPVPDCLGPHPRYCVFVRKRIRFGAFLANTAARKRSKTWIKTDWDLWREAPFWNAPFLVWTSENGGFWKRWWKLLQSLSLLSAPSDLLVQTIDVLRLFQMYALLKWKKWRCGLRGKLKS